MKKVVLAGNPNVGKSLIFSCLTGIGVVTANYAGTTVELKIGKVRYRDEDYEVVDGPGVYSLEEFSEADETALRLIDDSDILLNVVDATNLERNLNLTLQLLQKQKPMVLCLNFWEDTAHKGIAIDVPLLEKQLGIPVVTTSALRGEGIPDLLASLGRACTGNTAACGPDDSWNRIGAIVGQVQKLTHRHHTLLERLSDFTLHPVGGLVSAFVILISTLAIVRFLGEGLVNGVFGPLFSRIYSPAILDWVGRIPSELIRGLLIGHTADPLESFGILTSGVYIALVLVFPYFFSFYFMFGLLEDFGYLPRLSVVLDSFFHRLGLHGYSSIPVMLGLGCKVPAFMATRILTNRREKLLTISLILMSAPCLPQSAMIVSLGMRYGIAAVFAVFGVLLALALGMNMIINRVTRGDLPEFFTEIPAYRIPSVKLLASKLWIRIVDYFREVLPMIAIGVLIMNILDALHVIRFVTGLLRKPAAYLLGLPPEIAPIMLLGFLRKDVSIALLAPLHLSSGQFIVGSIFFVLYTPCIASFFTLVRELGIGSSLKIIGIVFFSALVSATLLHALFLLF